RYHLEKKGFFIEEEIASDLPEIFFDKEAMASVLINLLSNAMKFSPEKKEVKVTVYRKDDSIVLQVADKGIGISPEGRSRIFERFYRLQNRMTAESKGSGLGLTLVKHVVEAHGGQIRVESEPGMGSVFSVSIPVSAVKGNEGK
ncbi:MAG: sensor histidine kinase, partial [Candidatus Aminicenantes bacterium]|nr:sensor histidine kinase [Candidatus Aminicenantes bacterium]